MQKININNVQITQSSSTSSSSLGSVEQVLVWTLLHSFSAWSVQNIEHDIWAWTQLHLLEEHGSAEAQPHFIVCSTSAGTGDTFPGSMTGKSCPSTFVHPYCSGSACEALLERADIQIIVWWWARRTCSPNAGDVGGKDFNVGVLLILCLAIFDDHTP